MDNDKIALSVAAKTMGVSVRMILSASRLGRVVEARKLIVLMLYNEGKPDAFIAQILNRGRVAILKIRHHAMAAYQVSTVFRNKYDKAKSLYEHAKSLRGAES